MTLPNGRLVFGDFYAAAGAARIPIADMRAMSWWQFNETVDGYVRSKTGDKDEGLSAVDEKNIDALLALPID